MPSQHASAGSEIKRPHSTMSLQAFHDVITEAVKASDQLVEVKLSGFNKNASESSYRRVVIRPVELKRGRCIQISRFTRTQDLTSNHAPFEVEQPLQAVLAQSFRHAVLRTRDETMRFDVRRKGIVHVSREAAGIANHTPCFSHDHIKQVPLTPERDREFLQRVDIVDKKGRVRPSRHAKYVQVNAFLRELDALVSGLGQSLGERPIHVVDLGCGAGTLTFAAHHFLTNGRDVPAFVTGVDRDRGLISRNESSKNTFGITGMQFEASSISSYEPNSPPDVVVALHACDTATDDAISQAVRWGASAILVAPCCHHDLNRSLQCDGLQPLLRHRVLAQRFTDLVTDTFRVLALRAAGYKTDIVEFVPTEHTSRNLLIRARRDKDEIDVAALCEYQRFRDYCQIVPAIDRMVDDVGPPSCT